MKALINGKVLTVSHGTLDRGTVLIDGGCIVAVGTDIAVPEGVEVIDVSGKVVTPGLIDPHCHVGLMADGVGYNYGDVNEMVDPITPHVRALDAVDSQSPVFGELLAAGVTTVLTGPGSANVVGGQWVCLKTVPRPSVDQMVLMAPAGMKMALGENPKRVYGGRNKAPSTRMGNAAVLRGALVDTQNYMAKWERYNEELADYECDVAGGKESPKRPQSPARDLKLEALVPVLRREMKARIHVHQANDILTAIRIAEEFDLDITLEHVTEGYKVAEIIAEKGIPVTVGPVFSGRSKYELRAKHHKNPGVLYAAGVKVAIQTDAASAVQYLSINAALAAREGMPEDEALKAITLSAAEIIGVDDRVGSLDAGKDADIVVFSEHPFDYRAVAEMVFVDGELVYTRSGGLS
jgi:imidazolonepropionase-like amidohydrolase